MFIEIENLRPDPPRKYMINVYEIMYFTEDDSYGGKIQIRMKGSGNGGSYSFYVKESFDEMKNKIMNVKKYSKITPINRFKLMDINEDE